jgi:hypothetical protein
MKSSTSLWQTLGSPFRITVVLSCTLGGAFTSGSAGCSRNGAPADRAPEPPSAAVEALAPAPATPGASVPAPGLDTLTGRLLAEARNRPGVRPTADEVLAALGKLGATVPNKQQSLGDTYKARYCLGGYTPDGAFALSACEYPDAEAADAGRDLSRQILARVTARDVWSHKASTLAIVQLKPDATTVAREKELVAAFLAL